MDYYELGQRVRAFRKAQGFSQEQLAEKVDISVTHMSHIETGSTKLSLPVLTALAGALHVQVDTLLSDAPETTAAGDIQAILRSCTEPQARIIADIVRAAKQSMDRNL